MGEKPVGSAEMVILRWLHAHEGRWSEADGVIYESKFWTVELLGGLANKGLVREVAAGAHYTLTRKGSELAVGMAFTASAIPSPTKPPAPYTGVVSTRRTR